jgi:hypothetical protein
MYVPNSASDPCNAINMKGTTVERLSNEAFGHVCTRIVFFLYSMYKISSKNSIALARLTVLYAPAIKMRN